MGSLPSGPAGARRAWRSRRGDGGARLRRPRLPARRARARVRPAHRWRDAAHDRHGDGQVRRHRRGWRHGRHPPARRRPAARSGRWRAARVRGARRPARRRARGGARQGRAPRRAARRRGPRAGAAERPVHLSRRSVALVRARRRRADPFSDRRARRRGTRPRRRHRRRRRRPRGLEQRRRRRRCCSRTAALEAPSPFAGCGGENRIVFDDPFDEIDDPVDCRGVLGIGGYCYSDESRTVDGQVYKRIRLGKALIANGWGACPQWTACNLAQIATHEIGHAIGLGHSTDAERDDGRHRALRRPLRRPRRRRRRRRARHLPGAGHADADATATPPPTDADTDTPTETATPSGDRDGAAVDADGAAVGRARRARPHHLLRQRDSPCPACASTRAAGTEPWRSRRAPATTASAISRPATGWSSRGRTPTSAAARSRALDAALVLQASGGVRALDAEHRVACDVTGNGSVSPLDAARILQAVVGDLPRFPAAGSLRLRLRLLSQRRAGDQSGGGRAVARLRRVSRRRADATRRWSGRSPSRTSTPP